MPTDPTEPPVTLVLSAEVARPGVRLVPAGTFRIGKRVVTETRTVTVQVRREELYVEHIAAPDVTSAGLADSPVDTNETALGARGPSPVLVLVLHEDVPEVVTRVAPTERVSVFVDRVDGSEAVSTDLRHEEVALAEEHSRR